MRFPGDIPHRHVCLGDRVVAHMVTTVPQVRQFGPTVTRRGQAVPGDILYFDYAGNSSMEHAAVVNRVSGGQIYYAQHTENRYDVPLHSVWPNRGIKVYLAHVIG
ncbi:amidase domain-containing protein [Saccharothrix deserti]|uniref:amidase domain-containing protein n=1 Tax=Saccharothrix deserti TaxID=2593674 RepID=UPI00131DE5AF|nr:amidase domain-containing protein [Saccharothrix deserti]